MKNPEKRLKSLLSRTSGPPYLCSDGIEDWWQGRVSNAKTGQSFKFLKKQDQNILEIESLRQALGLQIKDIYREWQNLRFQRELASKEYEKTPVKEGRDNKGVYVGSGGGNKNLVRYPSKKRSKRTWKIFYEMFPWHAQRDGWDGETSKRMKK